MLQDNEKICCLSMLRSAALQVGQMHLHARSHVQAIAPVRYVTKCKPQGQRAQILLTRREIHSVHYS